jgi:hypothetical protein
MLGWEASRFVLVLEIWNRVDRGRLWALSCLWGTRGSRYL